jgi:hypothetical protein
MTVTADLAYLNRTDERKLAWQQELDEKVEKYYGEHIYLKLRDDYIHEPRELQMHLTEKEYAFIRSQLHQAVVDVEAWLKGEWDGGFIMGHYPKVFKFENGRRFGQEQRFFLLQIFI